MFCKKFNSCWRHSLIACKTFVVFRTFVNKIFISFFFFLHRWLHCYANHRKIENIFFSSLIDFFYHLFRTKNIFSLNGIVPIGITPNAVSRYYYNRFVTIPSLLEWRNIFYSDRRCRRTTSLSIWWRCCTVDPIGNEKVTISYYKAVPHTVPKPWMDVRTVLESVLQNTRATADLLHYNWTSNEPKSYIFFHT